MHTLPRFRTTALLVILAIVALASTANALRSISVTNASGNVSASGQLKFGDAARLDPRTEITCEVTLLRTIARAIAKREGAKIGKITGVAISDPARCRHGEDIREVVDIRALRQSTERLETNANCRELGGRVTLCDLSGPTPAERWDLIYRAFLGTLPDIRGIQFRVSRTAFKIRFVARTFSIRHTCLWEGDVEALVSAERGVATTGSILLSSTILNLIRRLEGVVCPDPASFGGTFTLNPAVTITLV